jgi:hypothetical protein
MILMMIAVGSLIVHAFNKGNEILDGEEIVTGWSIYCGIHSFALAIASIVIEVFIAKAGAN